MILAEEAVVSVYLEVMALLIMLGLILLSRRIDLRRKLDSRVFLIMCLCVVADGLCSAFCYAMHYQNYPWGSTAVLIVRTLQEAAILLLVYNWSLFTNHKIHHSREHIDRIYPYLFIPISACMLFLVVNLFTGILFTISADNLCKATPFYYVMTAIEVFYFLQAVGMILYYRRKGVRLHFFHVTPVIIPTVIGALVNILTPYSAAALGCAIGLIFLYFSMIADWRFDDPETEQYNREYLLCVRALARDGRRDCRNIVVFETDADPAVLAELLSHEIPRDGDLIHMGGGRFVLLLDQGDRSALELLELLVAEAVDEYNEEHPQEEISLKTEHHIRRADETASAFLEANT